MTQPTKVVIALGGNALEEKGLPPTSQSQMNVVAKTSEYIAQLSSNGYELARGAWQPGRRWAAFYWPQKLPVR